MKKTTLLLAIFFAVISAKSQLVDAATIQQGMMPVYFGRVANLDHFNAPDLERLRKAGITHLILEGNTIQDFQAIIAAFNTNAVLNKFKVILAVNGPAFNGYYECVNTPGCNIDTQLPQNLQDLLSAVVQLAINNPVAGGYYTFDEPSLQLVPNQPQGFKKEFQVNVYNYIRNLDPDINARPISMAHTMFDPNYQTLQDATITYSISNNAQDIFFIDQYNSSAATQTTWFQKWSNHGLTARPYVFILPAFNSSCQSRNVTTYANAISQAFNTVFPINKPVIKGLGFFAYWPVNKPDFNYGLDNCPAILDDTYSYLTGLPTGLMAKWRLDMNNTNSGPQGTAATIIGSPVFSNQYYVEGNGSLYFNGNNQGLELSPGTGFLKAGFTSRTLMLWVQPFAASSNQIIYEEGDSGNGMAVRINQNVLEVAMANYGINQVFSVPNTVIQTGDWYHFAVVYNQGALKIYVDGQEKLSATTHVAIGEHWDPAAVALTRTNGGLGNAFGAYDNTASFYGFIDEIQIHSVPLNPEKVFFTSQALFGQWRWNNNVANEGSGDIAAILRSATYTSNSSEVIEGSHSLKANGSSQGAELSSWGGYLRAEIKKRTLMLWVTPTTLNRYQMIFEEGDSGNGIAVRLNSSNMLEVAIACFGVNSIYTVPDFYFSLSTKYHITVVFNTGSVSIYVNNHRANFTFSYTALNPHWDDVGLGKTITSYGLGNCFGAYDATPGFAGIIDDCRIYNSALAESYIKDLCKSCGDTIPMNKFSSCISEPMENWY